MEDKATPRPWLTAWYGDKEPIHINADYGHTIAKLTTFPSKERQEADAALIVRAVNSYDAHRNALEWLRKAEQLAYQKAIGGPDEPMQSAWTWLANNCREALRAVEAAEKP